ncbi:hypothetical protein NDU88_004899 [Pleurodeles waltl]|uniref:Uncharacterized protein n=1 Tax=Pleurodeles waltl TaxID=8319 RepID=A0AAV7LMN8_PLEWA|nr:hypothetical protein NDU88_004899 [Pleurodeles waltl]
MGSESKGGREQMRKELRKKRWGKEKVVRGKGARDRRREVVRSKAVEGHCTVEEVGREEKKKEKKDGEGDKKEEGGKRRRRGNVEGIRPPAAVFQGGERQRRVCCALPHVSDDVLFKTALRGEVLEAVLPCARLHEHMKLLRLSQGQQRSSTAIGVDKRLQPSELHDRVREATSKREEINDKMSRKRRAKKRDIHVGDHDLICNRRSGSKFLLPFEKDLWVVSAIKGTTVTAKRKQETVTRNISFFKVFRMAIGGMEMEQNYPPASLFEDGDEGSVDCCNSRSLLPSPGMVVDDHLSADRGGADMQSSEVTQSSDQLLPESLPVSSLPPKQGLERYKLRPRPPRSTRLQRFVAD